MLEMTKSIAAIQFFTTFLLQFLPRLFLEIFLAAPRATHEILSKVLKFFHHNSVIFLLYFLQKFLHGYLPGCFLKVSTGFLLKDSFRCCCRDVSQSSFLGFILDFSEVSSGVFILCLYLRGFRPGRCFAFFRRSFCDFCKDIANNSHKVP